jgi:hypothetical protein
VAALLTLLAGLLPLLVLPLLGTLLAILVVVVFLAALLLVLAVLVVGHVLLLCCWSMSTSPTSGTGHRSELLQCAKGLCALNNAS